MRSCMKYTFIVYFVCMKENLITNAIEMVGLCRLAQHIGVTYQSVRRWEAKGRLPRSEWTGETNYASRIEEATHGQITRDQLLDLKRIAKHEVAKPLDDSN